MTIDERATQRRRAQETAGQLGAALLEFALVILLFFVLVFGIITYAYMMSFRQSLTQAGAEGARAAAVAPASFTDTQRIARALDAVEEAISGYGGGILCNNGVLVCTATVAACDPPPAPVTPRCVTVSVSYPYRSHPILPSFPGLGLTLPTSLEGLSVAEVSAP